MLALKVFFFKVSTQTSAYSFTTFISINPFGKHIIEWLLCRLINPMHALNKNLDYTYILDYSYTYIGGFLYTCFSASLYQSIKRKRKLRKKVLIVFIRILLISYFWWIFFWKKKKRRLSAASTIPIFRFNFFHYVRPFEFYSLTSNVHFLRRRNLVTFRSVVEISTKNMS